MLNYMSVVCCERDQVSVSTQDNYGKSAILYGLFRKVTCQEFKHDSELTVRMVSSARVQ